MDNFPGTFKLDRNENLDAFYIAAGVPWIARKFMLVSSPTMTVKQEKNDNEEDVWMIKMVTFTRTMDMSFKIDEPFEDTLPSGDIFTTVAKKDGDNKFILESTSEDNGSFVREYEFSEEGVVLTLKHQTGVEAKRYFKRITA